MDKIAVKEYLTQGMILVGQGKYKEALTYYDKAEQADPLEIEVYLSKGIAYANLNELDEADAQFKKALKIDRKSGLVHFHLGSVALLKGDIQSGFEYYNKAIAYGYDDAQAYYNLGLLHEENGEVDLAIRNYSKAINRDALRPDIRIRKIRLLIQENYMTEALHELDETILANPDVFEGYHLKIMLLARLGQINEAKEVLDAALKLFPDDVGFAFDQASLYEVEGEYEKAFSILKEIEQKYSDDDTILRKVCMDKAQLFAAQEDLDSAIDVLKQAKELAEKANDFDEEAVFLLANGYLAKENYQQLLNCAEELLENSGDNYIKESARYFKPFSLNKLGRFDEALPLYQDAIEEFRRRSLQHPGNMDSYLLRAMALRDIEEYEKALEIVDFVLEIQPDSAEPRVLRVNILESLGLTEEAQLETDKIKNMELQ